MLNVGDDVKIIGNNSQGIRHFCGIGETGYIELRRRGMIISGELKAVEAFKIRLKSGYFQIVAQEDLLKISDKR